MRVVEKVEDCAGYGGGGGVGTYASGRENGLVHGFHLSFWRKWRKKGEVPPVISRLASPINSGISNPDPIGLP